MEEKLEQFVQVFSEALSQIREPSLYATELGFQGELLAEIRHRLKGLGLPGDPIIQQEYQKTLPCHGIDIRPDLIIHIPFGRGQSGGRKKGNFVAVEMKVRASTAKAIEDFESLSLMKTALNYPLTIFLNIGSATTHANLCPEVIAEQTVCFATTLVNGEPRVAVERPVK